MAHGTIGTDGLRLEFNEPGVHPFFSILLRDDDGAWPPVALLGARQLRYFHKGASFPRLIVDGREQDTGPQVDMDATALGRTVLIRDMRGGFELETRISLVDGQPMIHVEHRLSVAGGAEPRAGGSGSERLAATTAFNRIFDRFDLVMARGEEGPDFTYVPHLRPRSDMVISDQVFRSPAAMVRKGDIFFALIPDLDLLAEGYSTSGARYYIDYGAKSGENNCPALNFGIGLSRVKGHVYFENDFQKEIQVGPGEELVLAYYLAADRSGFGPADVVSFIWERFGRPRYERSRTQTASWDRFASEGMERIFKRQDLFKQFELEGQECGGTLGIHFIEKRGVRPMELRALQRYLRYQDLLLTVSRIGIEQMSERPWLERLFSKAQYRYGPKVPPQVFFQAWYNNLRSAYGAYWFARRWKDHELLERAYEVKNLAILAPRENGAFPAVCYPTDSGVFWSRGTRGFKHLDWYNTADCATTGYHMAGWFSDHEGDPRLLARCRELANSLCDLQLESGAIPSWVQPTKGTFRVSADLKESAMTAASAMFLGRLFHIETDARYLQAAMKACDFLGREVMPRQKWFDFETFYSCSKKRLGLFDENTSSYPQNSLSMIWAAEAMRQVYLATLDEQYLALGLDALRSLCLYQQVWSPAFLSIDAFGGFGTMNTDAEWNDARQALAACVLMDYYRITGDPEHMQRGISALRAAFSLMFIEENNAVAPGNMSIAVREETGSVAENYAHFGHDHPIVGFLDSDWGTGSACYAAAYAQKHFGDIYVDMPRMRAFGINGCRVEELSEEAGRISLVVESYVERGEEILIKVAGAAPPGGVQVNGRQSVKSGTGVFKTLL